MILDFEFLWVLGLNKSYQKLDFVSGVGRSINVVLNNQLSAQPVVTGPERLDVPLLVLYTRLVDDGGLVFRDAVDLGFLCHEEIKIFIPAAVRQCLFPTIFDVGI